MKVILFTFAGREDRMFILEKYVQKVLDNNIIDEWHVWDYTKNSNDKQWIENNFKNKEKIKIKKRNPTTKFKFWGGVYEHYLKEEYKDCIFIKVDDDVLYFDTEELSEFIEKIKTLKESDFISANVINNPACYLLQRQYDYFDESLYNFSPDELWRYYKNAENIHKYFIKNYKEIHHLAKENNRFDELSMDLRISINFIGFKYGILKNIVDVMETKKIYDDEFIISDINRKENGGKAFLYERLVASHLTFNVQEKYGNSEEINNLIELYKNFNP